MSLDEAMQGTETYFLSFPADRNKSLFSTPGLVPVFCSMIKATRRQRSEISLRSSSFCQCVWEQT